MSCLTTLPPDVPKAQACRALNVPRHWCYPDRRQRKRAAAPTGRDRGLSEIEEQRILDELHSERFLDTAPRQVYATLLSEGTVLGSISTMYRLLGRRKETRERRNQRPAQHHVKPQLEATGPDQVYTWDITKLATITRGFYLSLYVILDLFSRYPVGWMVSRKENAGLACHLFREVLSRRDIEPNQLIVHQDRGSPMIAHSFGDLLSDLGVTRSFSRPRVSNDNAFSESQFKTLKYWPSYPGRFRDEGHARQWGSEFFPAYSRRPHEGLALFTPEDLYTGRFESIWQVRQAAMDRHYAAHPERYVKGPPRVARPPTVVSINPDDGQTAAELLDKPDAFQISPTPVNSELPEVVT
ncbi:DDE-type integrase/transposase/recombinase [Wenzhouxiangella sp. AB-CW3]|uniref:DDE-type integrase/transposase/recombinase n=1 Tax=Wenzhouxiangella sp. AB-CW3 TaxID=2771012 RepID=UPI00168A43FB|nr:DDE-type integrase/transposase/recombinase [Wenzhouxiangella sp. AB-CW3]QOC22238.1 DDE-type integrase/transposase/recombinase [Wenzhouxiangella sp. AB-CW3]